MIRSNISIYLIYHYEYIKIDLLLFSKTINFHSLLWMGNFLATLHTLIFPSTTYQYKQAHGLVLKQFMGPYKLGFHKMYQWLHLALIIMKNQNLLILTVCDDSIKYFMLLCLCAQYSNHVSIIKFMQLFWRTVLPRIIINDVQVWKVNNCTVSLRHHIIELNIFLFVFKLFILALR